jgi:hypothetical protein
MGRDQGQIMAKIGNFIPLALAVNCADHDGVMTLI